MALSARSVPLTSRLQTTAPHLVLRWCCISPVGTGPLATLSCFFGVDSSGSRPFGSTPFLGVLLSSLLGVHQHPFLTPPSFPPALPLQHWAHWHCGCQPDLGSHLSDLPFPGHCKFASDYHHYTSSFPYGCEVPSKLLFFPSRTYTSLGYSLCHFNTFLL